MAGVSAVQPSEARQIFNPPPPFLVPSAAPSPTRPRKLSRNSETVADTTIWPSSLISTRPAAVSPITSAERPYFTATCWILAEVLRSQEMTTRLASSPNKTNSGGSPCEAKSTSTPMPWNPDSAQRHRDPAFGAVVGGITSPVWSFLSGFLQCRFFLQFQLRRITPQLRPESPWRTRTSQIRIPRQSASPGSAPRSRTIARPASRKSGRTALCTSSKMPTTPSTGVG